MVKGSIEGFNRRPQGCLQGSMLETETTNTLRASENGEGFNRRSQGCLQGSMLKGSMLGLSVVYRGSKKRQYVEGKRFNFDFFLFNSTTVFNENRRKCYSL